MISDNYLTGDNIFLRELQNFFFEVLGMMSITHYGAIGDGITDNYGPLQVAIDDANRRKLSYIYVPYGRYIYTGELINIGEIIFVGNPNAKIINIRTGVEIPIEQFGANMRNHLRNLEGMVILANGTDPTNMFKTGWYYTGEYSVFLGSIGPNNVVAPAFTMFYFDADTKTLTTPYQSVFYENSEWGIFQNSYIESELTNSRGHIPCSSAVYEALQDVSPKNNVITACLDENYSLDDTLGKPPLSQLYRVGEGLKISDNVIEVGQGINMVEVQAQVIFSVVSSDGTRDLHIRSGGHTRVLNSRKMTITGRDKIISCASVLVPVQQNDKIFIYVGGNAGDVVAGKIDQYAAQTYITVRAVN